MAMPIERPTVVINENIIIPGAITYEELKTQIEEELLNNNLQQNKIELAQ